MYGNDILYTGPLFAIVAMLAVGLFGIAFGYVVRFIRRRRRKEINRHIAAILKDLERTNWEMGQEIKRRRKQ